MIQLTVNPIVLQTLQQHFPKPNNSATRALDKYVMLMTAQISDSIIRGRTVHQVIKGLYTFSIYKQRTRGSQIGSKKIRLQNWLEENNLKLFRVVELGTSRSHKLSVIQLTDLVTLTNTMTVLKSEEELETENLQNLLYTQAVSNKQLFESLYPEIEDLNEFDIRNLFEFVPIDVRSLRNYIQWLGHDSTLIDARKKAQYLVQADTILRVAQHTDGFYVQRRKASSFGRTYYSGISVQNVNKELRRAMLGHCWDYDVRSAGVVLARIHDAIIVKRRLGADHKIDIEMAIRAQTENPYWHLQPTELEPYHRPLSLDKEEIQAHQARIAAEEQAAKRQIELKRRSAVESCN